MTDTTGGNPETTLSQILRAVQNVSTRMDTMEQRVNTIARSRAETLASAINSRPNISGTVPPPPREGHIPTAFQQVIAGEVAKPFTAITRESSLYNNFQSNPQASFVQKSQDKNGVGPSNPLAPANTGIPSISGPLSNSNTFKAAIEGGKVPVKMVSTALTSLEAMDSIPQSVLAKVFLWSTLSEEEGEEMLPRSLLRQVASSMKTLLLASSSASSVLSAGLVEANNDAVKAAINDFTRTTLDSHGVGTTAAMAQDALHQLLMEQDAGGTKVKHTSWTLERLTSSVVTPQIEDHKDTAKRSSPGQNNNNNNNNSNARGGRGGSRGGRGGRGASRAASSN